MRVEERGGGAAATSSRRDALKRSEARARATQIHPRTQSLDRAGGGPKDEVMSGRRQDEPRSWFRRRLPLESETSWLLLLGVLDLLITVALLRSGQAREANPLAQWVLGVGGVRGLVLFKCGLLAVVAVSAQIIATRHLRVGQGILRLGIAAQLVVVAYGVKVLVGAVTP